MTKKPLQKRKFSSQKFWLLTLLCLGTFVGMNAQRVSWQQLPVASPSLSSTTVGVFSEDVTLDLQFAVVSGSLAASGNAIRVILPAGITLVSAERVAANDQANIVLGTPSATTGTVNIPINSMSSNNTTRVAIKLRATSCAQTGSRGIELSILSGGVALQDQGSATVKSVTLDVRIPALTVTNSAQNLSAARNTDVQFEAELGTANVVAAKSMKITIAKDKFTTLSAFMLGAKPVTPATETPTSVVLDLTEALVGATPISGAGKQTLTFKAQSSVGGLHTMAATYTYPQTGTACTSNASLFTHSLSTPSATGSANLERPVTLNWMTAEPKTGAAMPLKFNGVDANYLRIYVRNTGNIAIAKLRMQVNPENTGTGTFRGDYYIDETLPVYYALSNSTAAPATSAVTAIDKTADNCVYVTNMIKNGYYRILKDEYLTKRMGVQFNVPGGIPAGDYLHIYIPIVQGLVYDNSDWTQISRTFQATGAYNIASAVNFNQVAAETWDENGKPVTSSGSAYSGRRSYSNFYTALPTLSVKAGQTASASMDVNYINTNAGIGMRSEFYLQLPKWLELDGATPTDWHNAILMNGSVAAKVGNTVTLLSSGDEFYDANCNTYFFVFNSATNGTLTIKYKALADGTGTGEYDYNGINTATATIRYWFNLQTPDTSTPILPYIAKNTQDISCIVVPVGVTMNSFELNRITRGLKSKTLSTATNGTVLSRTPGDDDGSGSAPLAPFSEIDNKTYLPGDTGHIKINADILSTGYKYMYVLISAANMANFDFTNFATSPDLKVTLSGTDLAADALVTSGTKTYARFTATGTFPTGTVDITIPFAAKTTNIPYAALQTEVYMATDATPPADPFNPGAARIGEDLLSGQWRVHNAYGSILPMNASNPTINTVGQLLQIGAYYNSRENGGYLYPNEYRPYQRPQKVTVRVPTGLNPTGIRLDVVNTTYADVTSNAGLGGSASRSITNTSTNPVVTVSGSNTLYEYDITGLFDFTADSYEEAVAAAAASKWITPDDGLAYYFFVTVEPLASAPASGTISAVMALTNRPAFTNTVEQTVFVSFVNNAPRGDLNIPSKDITVYSKEVNVASVIPAITGGSARPAWLYIDGDVSNILLRNKTAGTNISSASKWVSLGTASTATDYGMYFTLNDMSQSSIKVYLIADFDNSGLAPSGDIAAFLANPANAKYISQNQTLNLTLSGDSRIQGSISTEFLPATGIAYETPYDMVFSANSKTGAADVVNPVITLTVPTSQTFTELQYQLNGTWTTLAGGALATVKSLFDNTPAGQDVVINMAQVLGAGDIALRGNMVNSVVSGGNIVPVTDANRELNLRVTFTPICQTSLTGINYTLHATGAKPQGGAAVADAQPQASLVTFTNVTSDNIFTTAITTADGNMSFGGETLGNTLSVRVNKDFGDVNLSDKDYVELVLPKWLQIDGNILINAPSMPAIHNTTVTPRSSQVIGEELIVQITVPYATLNLSNAGKDMPFTYIFDVTYAGDNSASLLAQPLRDIKATVYTMKNFDIGGETCLPAPFVMGTSQAKVALISFRNPLPYSVCAGVGLPLQITSAGFSGTWDTPAESIGTGAAVTYTPAIADFLTTTVVPVTITSDFNPESYGEIQVSVTVKAAPVLTELASWTESVCSGQLRNDVVLSATPGGAAISWTAAASPAGAVTGFTANNHFAGQRHRYTLQSCDPAPVPAAFGDCFAVFLHIHKHQPY